MKFMKFNMIEHSQTPDYAYDYRIELLDFGLQERECLADWIEECNIPCSLIFTPGNSHVLYLRKQDAALFALRWGG